MRKNRLLPLLVILAVFTYSNLEASTKYSVTNLGDMYAMAINNAGQIVGRINSADGLTRAVLWEKGSVKVLEDFGLGSVAKGINNAGQIVGYADVASNNPSRYAVLWENNSFRNLGPGDANAINDAGIVVGSYSTRLGAFPAVWVNGVYSMYGSNLGIAKAINTTGTIAGDVKTWVNNGVYRGDYTQASIFVPGYAPGSIGTLGGAGSSASDINDAGQIIGMADTAGAGPSHPFIWDNGVMQDLNWTESSSTVVSQINNSGDIVGYAQNSLWSNISPNTFHALLWENGTVIDLSTIIIGPGYQLVTANAINDFGQIVGTGYSELGKYESFLLTPDTTSVPEPTSILLLGIGSMVLGIYGRYHRRHRIEI
jgi:probable HAF family extracellular repeat protein